MINHVFMFLVVSHFSHCLPCLKRSPNHLHVRHWHPSGARGSALAANKWRQHSRCLKICVFQNKNKGVLASLPGGVFTDSVSFHFCFIINVTYQGKAKMAVSLDSNWLFVVFVKNLQTLGCQDPPAAATCKGCRPSESALTRFWHQQSSEHFMK